MIEGVLGPAQHSLLLGIQKSCRESHINCIYLCGGALQTSPVNPFERQRNFLYDLISPVYTDGILLSCSLGNFTSNDIWQSFIEKTSKYPLVTIGQVRRDIPCVQVDNMAAIEKLAIHLLGYHGYRKFAFISGPSSNSDGVERMDAFRRVCADYGIPDQNIDIFEGDFLRSSGQFAARQLIEKGIHSYDVIVCGNDLMALGVLDELAGNGISVPEDIAVAGIDGIPEGHNSIPKLTSVHQDFELLGAQAVELLLNIIDQSGPAEYSIKSTEPQLVNGESCGCGFNVSPSENLLSDLTDLTNLEAVLRPLLQVKGLEFDQECRLLMNGLSGLPGNYSSFLYSIEGMVKSSIKRARNPIWIASVLETFQNTLEMYSYGLSHNPHVVRQCITKAVSYVYNVVMRFESTQHISLANESDLLSEMAFDLSSCVDEQRYISTLDLWVCRFPIDKLMIVLYDNDTRATEEVFYRYSRLPETNFTVNSKRGPHGFPFSEESDYFFVVESLYYNERPIGYLVMDAPQLRPAIFSALRKLVSSSLQGLYISQNLHYQSAALRQANEELRKLHAYEQKYNAMVKQEMKNARDIQLDFMPSELPGIRNYECSFRFMPANEIAGDFYDMFQVSDSSVCIVVGDVCGKNFGVALFMSLVRSLIRSQCLQSTQKISPLDMITFINDYMMKNHRKSDSPNYFTSLFLAFLHHDTGVLDYVNAGHQPPILIRSNREVEMIKRSGPAIGLSSDITYKSGQTEILPGDLLFISTDGLSEFFGDCSLRKGICRIVELLQTDFSGAENAVTKIVSELQAEHQAKKQNDDITLLALYRNPKE